MPMIKLSKILGFLLALPAITGAATFDEAEAKFKAQTEGGSAQTESAETAAVNAFWASTSRCHEMEGPATIQVILELNPEGNISGAWTDTESPKGDCIKEQAMSAAFPEPSKPPVYFKVIM